MDERKVIIMSLRKGSSRAAISANIKTEMAAGKPRKQAIAIALRVAGKSRRPKRKLSTNDAAHTMGHPDSGALAERHMRNAMQRCAKDHAAHQFARGARRMGMRGEES
jgi:hypothetical protein